MAHLSQLMNGMVCFIYSLKLCYFSQRDTRRSVQTLIGPQRPCSLWLRAHAQLTSCWGARTCQLPDCVLCPGPRQALRKADISLYHGTNAPTHSRQVTPKGAITSAPGCARYLDQGGQEDHPHQDMASVYHGTAMPAQGIPHLRLCKAPTSSSDPLCTCTQAPAGSGQQQWSWGWGRDMDTGWAPGCQGSGKQVAENTSRGSR